MATAPIQTEIYKISYPHLISLPTLQEYIYTNMDMHFYWGDDLSASYYIAQAKAGFIAITAGSEEEKILLPEIQYSYAILDFANLHISTKVQKLLRRKELQIEVSHNLEQVFAGIVEQHTDNWLTSWYQDILLATQGVDDNFQPIAVAIKEGDAIVAGEIGYIIGKVYTSLSGFCSREKAYNNYGIAQLVLLATYLEEKQFAFWNLGHPSFAYKMAMGAEEVSRQQFLGRWLEATQRKYTVQLKVPDSFPNGEE